MKITWLDAIHLFARLIGCFGDPAFIAGRRTLHAWTAQSLRRGLGRLEALLRALLVRAAQTLPELKARAPFSMPPATRDWGRAGFANADPAAWGVHFALSAPASRRVARSVWSRRKPKPRPFWSAPVASAPLAERLEAARRVLFYPKLYIRRMQRVLLMRARRPSAVPRTMRSIEPGPRDRSARPSPLDPGSRSAYADVRPGDGSSLPRPDE